jgi:predicted nucleic acid-binding protein
VIVVDASLAVKWFLDEPLSGEAEEILGSHTGQIIVPDILVVEVTSALVRNANMVKSSRPNVLIALDRFACLLADGDLVAHRSSGTDVRQSAGIAIELGHPLKDCIYLVLAMELGCELVTCDAKFAEKALAVWDRVRVLGV